MRNRLALLAVSGWLTAAALLAVLVALLVISRPLFGVPRPGDRVRRWKGAPEMKVLAVEPVDALLGNSEQLRVLAGEVEKGHVLAYPQYQPDFRFDRSPLGGSRTFVIVVAPQPQGSADPFDPADSIYKVFP